MKNSQHIQNSTFLDDFDAFGKSLDNEKIGQIKQIRAQNEAKRKRNRMIMLTYSDCTDISCNHQKSEKFRRK